jgi:hypothetical protein
MADATNQPKRGGCFGRLILLFLLALFAGLLAAVYCMAVPQEASDLDLSRSGAGNGPNGPPTRDLSAVLAKSLQHGHSLAIRESEINQWLTHTLHCEQSGLLARWVTLDRVRVRLENEYAEVILQRSVMGRPVTVSLFVSIHQTTDEQGRTHKQIQLHRGPYTESLPRPRRGGRFGSLVVPEGYLYCIQPSFRRLAMVYEKELRLAFEEMAEVRFEKNRLILLPRPATPQRAPRS